MTDTSAAKMVPMDVKYHGAWLTWVASTTSCLKALGMDCDLVDVAGMSGYAFHLGINKCLCPSGPTYFDWGRLRWGLMMLGRSAMIFEGGECISAKDQHDRTKAQAKSAFEFVKKEIEEGRPCVIWGAYLPEFAVVVGIEGNSYVVKSYRECIGQPQPPIPHDELEAPGGIYILAFPNETKPRVGNRDKYGLINASLIFNEPSFEMHYGEDGYDFWIDELKAKKASSFGISYNTACYHEGRVFAKEFLKRVAERNPFAKDELMKASKLYEDTAKEFKKLTTLFPFPGDQDKFVTDEKAIEEGVDALKKAKKSECKAMKIIEKVARMEWSK